MDDKLDVSLSYTKPIVNKEVTARQKNILAILKRKPNITKAELIKRLSNKNDPITVYQLEREFGILQGKGLLNDKLQVINIDSISELSVSSGVIKDKPIKSSIVKGFYAGTNTTEQNRKWLRDTINRNREILFSLNPDKTLELVQLRSDKSYLRKGRISLDRFPNIQELFEQALKNLEDFANIINDIDKKDKKNEKDEKDKKDWSEFVTLLIDFIIRIDDFVETYSADENGNFYGRPDTFEDYEFNRLTSYQLTTKDLIKNFGDNSTNDIPKSTTPYFNEVYDAIIDILNKAKNKPTAAIQEADETVEAIIENINLMYIYSVTNYLSKLNENVDNPGRKAQIQTYIDHCKKTDIDDYDSSFFYGSNDSMFFVALWCLYWRIYYKEL